MSYNRCSNCLKCILALALLIKFQVASAQDTTLLGAVLRQHAPAYGGKLAVMIWRDSLVYARALGADYTLQTQEEIGCASAWLTAALVMTFVEEGKISLDDPVSRYLPIFSKYAKSYLTIRHCLANTTGLEGEKGGIERLFQKSRFMTLEEQVDAFASSREILNNPGEVFAFHNIGTNIAGRVLEVIGRRGFDRLMMERIFRPLGMKKSSFMSERAVNPFSGAVSTAQDMLRFLQMLLNGGVLGTKRVLQESSVQEILRIQTGSAVAVSLPDMVRGMGYGLGHWIDESAGSENRLHIAPGFSGGWHYIHPNRKYACVILGRPAKGRPDHRALYDEMMRALEETL